MIFKPEFKRTFLFLVFLASFKLIVAQESNYRDSIDVLKYDIHISEFDFAKHSISVRADITLKPVYKQLNSISLDLLDFEVDSVWLEGLSHSFSYDYKVLKLDLDNDLTKDTKLSVFYKGKPSIDSYWGGFYFKDGYAFNYGVGMAATPPNFGRAWFPCIDNFSDRANYSFHLTCNKLEMAVANGLLDSVSVYEKTKVFHWSTQIEIPTYLAAIAVGEFTEIEDTYQNTDREIPVSLFVPFSKKEKALKSFQFLKGYMQTYESLFGNYIWEKIAYVSVPFRGGAMEHAGLISVSNSSVDGTLNDETLIAHELSHHWFGNLVTCASEKDMWLNEGWASYCEALMIRDLKGVPAYKDYNRKNHSKVLNFAHKRDGAYLALYGIGHKNTYGATVYDKGADVVYALHQYLGDSLFFATTQKYLKEFALKTVTSQQFCDFYTKTSGIDLKDFFDSWLYSTGFPYFSVADFSSVNKKDYFSTKVVLNEGLKYRADYSKSNLIELTLVGRRKSEIKKVSFSGKEQEFEFNTDFEVLAVILDKGEKLVDAAVRNTMKVSGISSFTFNECAAKINVIDLSRMFDLQISKNYIKPDNFEKAVFGKYYWTVSGLISAKAKLTFTLENEYQFKNDENAKLYYRKNASKSWSLVGFDIKKISTGVEISTNLVAGEFCIGLE